MKRSIISIILVAILALVTLSAHAAGKKVRKATTVPVPVQYSGAGTITVDIASQTLSVKTADGTGFTARVKNYAAITVAEKPGYYYEFLNGQNGIVWLKGTKLDSVVTFDTAYVALGQVVVGTLGSYSEYNGFWVSNPSYYAQVKFDSVQTRWTRRQENHPPVVVIGRDEVTDINDLEGQLVYAVVQTEYLPTTQVSAHMFSDNKSFLTKLYAIFPGQIQSAPKLTSN